MDYCCSEGCLRDKIICDLDKTPDLSQRSPQNCPKCGNPVDGHYCQGCALLRKKFKEDLFAYCIENGILQDSSEQSYDNTNVVNALREPFVFNQDPGKNSSQSPPQINHHCYYECVVPDQEPFNNQTVDELPQTPPSFNPTFYYKDGNSFTCDSTSNLFQDSPNVFSPPLQPPIYSHEFCGNDAYYGQDCSLQELEVYINILNWDHPIICYNDDDDENYAIAVTPSLSTEEPDNSLSMGYEHLDTVPATESDEFIKSTVESLIPIPSESEGVPNNMRDVPFHDNSLPLDVSKDQFEDLSDSNDEYTLTDDDSFSIDNIEYVEASPLDSELISSEVMEIVIPKVGGIDDDILLTIKDDILREKLLNINLLIANIKALNDNPTPSSDFITNGSTTTRSDISLPEYEVFYDNHIKEISSGSTTTHSDSSLYDSFIFDLLINPFPPVDRSNFYEFVNELSYIISPPEYDYLCFKIEHNSGDFTMDVVEDISLTREPRVYIALPTHPNLQLNLDFMLSSESLFAYVVWIFLPFLSYSVAPQYLLSLGNEDTIFDPGIFNYQIPSFLLDVSHQSGTSIKFKVLNESLMKMSFFTCSPRD
nr:hypothetical protein [Tanacetum cinerariifolium]